MADAVARMAPTKASRSRFPWTCNGNTDLLPQRRRGTQVVSDYQSDLIVLAAAALFLLWPRLFHGDRTPEWLWYTATVLLTLALGLVRFASRRGARLLRNLLGI